MAKNSPDIKATLDQLYGQIKLISDADAKLGKAVVDEITPNLKKYFDGMVKRLKLTDKTLEEQEATIKKIQTHSESSATVLKLVAKSFEKAVVANKAAFEKLNESGKLAKIFQSDEFVANQSDKLDKSGLTNSIKPKWIKKEGKQGITSYKKRNLSVSGKPNTLTEAITNAEVNEPKRGLFGSISDKLYQGMLKLLDRIEKNTRSKSDKNKPFISTGSPIGDPGNKKKSKRKKKGAAEKEEDTRTPAEKEYDDLNYKSFEGTTFNTIQDNMEPGAQLAMQVVKHQILLHKKRKADKAKKIETEKDKERAAALAPVRDEKGLFRKRTSEEQTKYDAAKASQTSGEPESKVKFDLATVKSERIKDDPSLGAAAATGASGGRGILGTIADTVGALAPAAGGLAKGAARIAMQGARFLGPAAAVAGAGYAGYQAGKWLRNTSMGDSLGLSDKASEENRSLMGGWSKEDEDAGKLSPETLAIMAKKKAKSAELNTQQQKTDTAKKQESAAQVTTVNSPKTTTNVVSGSNSSGGKGIGTRNTDSSFVRYLDSRTNFA